MGASARSAIAAVVRMLRGVVMGPMLTDRAGATICLAAMDELAGYERRLRRAGLPLLIEDYSAWEDVFTRAVPLLSLVVTGQLLGAVDKDWPWWGNALALLGALAIVTGGVAMINRARGRKPLSVPDCVGPMELAVFVLVPALLPLVFGGQVTSALVTAGGNLLLLLLIYGVVGIGLLSILRWTAARLVSQLAASLVLLTRAVPVLLIFMIVLFINTEMWQVFSDVSDPALPGSIARSSGSGRRSSARGCRARCANSRRTSAPTRR